MFYITCRTFLNIPRGYCVIYTCKLYAIFQSVMLNSNELMKVVHNQNPINQYAINVNIFIDGKKTLVVLLEK